jgi:hypothetical protein
MTKSTISDWSTTAANNTDIGGINIAEGCAAANINNALREIMAQVKAALQTSATDNTAGALMTVPAFGIGVTGTATALDDLDETTTASGVYSVSASTTGTWPMSAGSGMVEILRRASTGFVQILTMTGTARTFQRRYSSGFGTWYELYHRGNIVGTVSESGGVPTGAIIESGSNANGYYTKWADGTMICRHKLASSSSAAVTWTFPVAFVGSDDPVFSVTARTIGSQVGGQAEDVELDYMTFSAWASGSRVVSTCRLFAMGNWF